MKLMPVERDSASNTIFRLASRNCTVTGLVRRERSTGPGLLLLDARLLELALQRERAPVRRHLHRDQAQPLGGGVEVAALERLLRLRQADLAAALGAELLEAVAAARIVGMQRQRAVEVLGRFAQTAGREVLLAAAPERVDADLAHARDFGAKHLVVRPRGRQRLQFARSRPRSCRR